MLKCRTLYKIICSFLCTCRPWQTILRTLAQTEENKSDVEQYCNAVIKNNKNVPLFTDSYNLYTLANQLTRVLSSNVFIAHAGFLNRYRRHETFCIVNLQRRIGRVTPSNWFIMRSLSPNARVAFLMIFCETVIEISLG